MKIENLSKIIIFKMIFKHEVFLHKREHQVTNVFLPGIYFNAVKYLFIIHQFEFI